MVELRALHFSDIHEDYAKLEAIQEFLEEQADTEDSIDTVFFTGDMIEDHPALGKEGAYSQAVLKSLNNGVTNEDEKIMGLLGARTKFIQENFNDSDQQLSPEKIDEWQQIENSLITLGIKNGKDQIVEEIDNSYQRLAEEFKKITNYASVFSIMGNHDIASGRDHFSYDDFTFVELSSKEEAKAVGRSGIEFIIKGDINSWEFPPLHNTIYELCGLKLEPLAGLSGYTAQNLDKQIAEAEEALKTEENSRNKSHLSILMSNKEQLEEIKNHQKNEKTRLGDSDEVDIYLTHKLPNAGKAVNVYGPASGDIAAEYSANASCTYGGHFHGMQIGNKSIGDRSKTPEDFFNELMKQKGNGTTKIDGVNVPTYYLEEDEPWTLNPGINYVTVTEYNKEKEIERVIIYEYVDE